MRYFLCVALMKHRTLLATLAGLLLVIGLAATSPWDQLRDSFAALSADMTTVKAEQAALGTKVEGLGGEVAELKVSGQNAAAEIAKLSVRVTALEKPPVPDPIPDPVPEPEPPGEFVAEYLGSFYPPVPTDEDKASGDVMRQFAFGHGIACRGPTGIYLGGRANDGNDVTCYVAEITVPEPSRTSPPRAEYIQPFANLVRPAAIKPDLAGLAYDESLDRLYVSIDIDYNVSSANPPTLCWGPGTLSKHVGEGTPLYDVTNAAGVKIHAERVAVPLAITPLGFTFVNQRAKGEFRRGTGPCLATAEITETGATNFVQHLFLPLNSPAFPDPPNGWNQTCYVAGVEYIDGLYVFSGVVGLATGLPELTGQNYYYGGPSSYPLNVDDDPTNDVNICKGPAAKGYHAPPYESRLWFMAYENGAWRLVRTVNLSDESLMGPNDGCGQRIGSMIWLPEKRWLLLAQGGARPEIHVLAVK